MAWIHLCSKAWRASIRCPHPYTLGGSGVGASEFSAGVWEGGGAPAKNKRWFRILAACHSDHVLSLNVWLIIIQDQFIRDILCNLPAIFRAFLLVGTTSRLIIDAILPSPKVSELVTRYSRSTCIRAQYQIRVWLCIHQVAALNKSIPVWTAIHQKKKDIKFNLTRILANKYNRIKVHKGHVHYKTSRPIGSTPSEVVCINLSYHFWFQRN